MTAPSSPARTWRSLAGVVLGALVAFAAANAVFQRLVSYPPARREVEDAVRDLHLSDPTTLVIGSSHARTFDSVGARLGTVAPKAGELLAVPLEFGKLTSYEWVLRNRVWPVSDGREGGAPHRNLRRVLLVTEWWDSCDPNEGLPSTNLPARAWTIGDFLGDVRAHGLTSYNRNYVRYRWTRLFRSSIVMRDRGQLILFPMLMSRLRPRPEADSAQYEAQTAEWRRMVEDGDRCILAPAQMAALDRMLADFAARGLETTILLYPRKPGTLTDRARATTLARFSAAMDSIGHARGLRVIDMTTTSPLRDADFAEDFDHIRAPANGRFASWALEGGLSWLRQPPGSKPRLPVSYPAVERSAK